MTDSKIADTRLEETRDPAPILFSVNPLGQYGPLLIYSTARFYCKYAEQPSLHPKLRDSPGQGF